LAETRKAECRLQGEKEIIKTEWQLKHVFNCLAFGIIFIVFLMAAYTAKITAIHYSTTSHR